MTSEEPLSASAAASAAYRLPRDVEPLTYRLTFEPDLDAATFTGTADIDLVIHEPGPAIRCHAADLDLSAASLTFPDGTAVELGIDYHEADEQVSFTLAELPPPGPATLRCSFTGELNDHLRGFYRSTFTDPDGNPRTIATTQMESVDARRAFPCWDEPDRKAVFEITLIVPDGLPAYSNTNIVEELDLGGARRSVRFAPTIKMSSYLVAMVVGPLEATDPVNVDGVALRVVYPPGKGHLTGFAVEVGAFALRFFTDYFGIAYPGDKCDLVAIPDFAMGAMENLGCITFRETALLIDPGAASRLELERVVDVVCHELAHMWFGDLVTMGWWEGIWLNEAFATFMETMCGNAFRPAWKRWVGFGLDRELALATDGLHATRPIEYPVGPPSDVEGMFDVLTYKKGGSVLRMLEQYLGEDVFRDGVRRYLNDHLYANTETSDLWDAIESVSGQPVRSVMETWILQGGHPLVTLEGTVVSQQPFAYLAEPLDPPSAIGATWQIPLGVRRLGGGAVAKHLLGPEPIDLAAAAGGETGRPEVGDGPLVVNAQGWGVYRTAYAPEHTAALAARLGDLEPLEKADLFADTWATVLAGRSTTAEFYALAAGLGDEGEPNPWTTTLGALAMGWRAASPDDEAAFAEGVRALLGPKAEQLGWTAQQGENERTPQLRAQVLAALGTYGHDEAVRAEALGRFDRFVHDGQALAPDLASAILAITAAVGRPGDYDAVLARFRDPATPQEEIRSLDALTQFPQHDLAMATFDLLADEVRTQNAPYIMATLLMNRWTGPAVWDRLKGQWVKLLSRFPDSSHSRMLAGARLLCEDADLVADVHDFLTEHPVTAAPRSVAQTIERLHVNHAFVTRERPHIVGTLRRAAGA